MQTPKWFTNWSTEFEKRNNARFDNIESRLDNLDNRVIKLENKLETVITLNNLKIK